MRLGLIPIAATTFLVGAGPQTDSVPALLRQLDQPERRTAALAALADLGPAARPALPALMAMLRSAAPSSEEFPAAARALGRIGPEARPALPFLRSVLITAKLNEATGRGREAAAAAVRAILAPEDPGLATYARRLARALADTDPFVRVEAARGLRELGPCAAPAVPELRRALRRDPAPKIRALAAEALGAIGPQAGAARDDLRRATRDSEDGVRRQAVVALAALSSARK
jgi:HEAT repeat protein